MGRVLVPIVVFLIVVVGIYALAVHLSTEQPVRKKYLAETQAELTRAEKCLDEIRELAYQYAEIDHPLSSAIRVKIREYYNQEGNK